GYRDTILDSELADWLSLYVPSTARKIVIVDSCYSGGFWPDELERVPNVTLLASAAADQESYRYPTGDSAYTNALVEGLKPTSSQYPMYAKADSDSNGLTYRELHDWAYDYMLLKRAEFEGEDLPLSALETAIGFGQWESVSSTIAGDDVFFGNGSAPSGNHSPVAAIGGALGTWVSPGMTGTIQLYGTSSFDPDGDTLAYQWSMDGKVVGTDSSLSLSLPPATYSVELIVTDGRTGSGSASSSIEIATAGDSNGDGQVNVSDIFYLVNYLFAEGAPPNRPSDVNLSGNADVGDIFWLINYLRRLMLPVSHTILLIFAGGTCS
ncbi:MAG: hypothetical protein KY432_08170, partial [Acidobacteria bacterium]|nr:hypothetical protein [Acidobacteriota bacterium]